MLEQLEPTTEPSDDPLPLNRSSVLLAYDAIKSIVHRTPIFTSASISDSFPDDVQLIFKAENLQKGGAFKFRGATFSLSRLTEDQLSKGVCTHSSGRAIMLAFLKLPGYSRCACLTSVCLKGTMLEL